MKAQQRYRQRLRRARRIRFGKPSPAEANRESLQQALGQPVQAKLRLGARDDPREHAADAVAGQVMRASDTPGDDALVQRDCATCAGTEEEQLQRQTKPEVPEETTANEEDKEEQTAQANPADGMAPNQQEEETVQAKAGDDSAVDEEEQETLQAKPQPNSGGGTVAADTAARVQARRGSGVPLPTAERGFFEPRLGSDLSAVRLHNDSEAGRLSGRLAARAFTVGNDVFFGHGQYRPASPSGRRLMAHELAHVLQQRGNEPRVQRESITLRAKAPDAVSSTGHAFVILEDGKGKDVGRGLYPACTKCGNAQCDTSTLLKMGVGVDVPGEICGDLNHRYDKSIDYAISKKVYTKIKKRADADMKNPPAYDLLSYNCVDYLRSLAKLGGVTVPDFPGVDEPVEVTAHIQRQLEIRVLNSGTLTLSGPTQVDLGKAKPTFSISGLPASNDLRFQWAIADADGKRYAMWSRNGQVHQYGRQSSAYIGSQTRALLKKRGIRSALVLCRVLAAHDHKDAVTRLFKLKVSFS